SAASRSPIPRKASRSSISLRGATTTQMRSDALRSSPSSSLMASTTSTASSGSIERAARARATTRGSRICTRRRRLAGLALTFERRVLFADTPRLHVIPALRDLAHLVGELAELKLHRTDPCLERPHAVDSANRRCPSVRPPLGAGGPVPATGSLAPRTLPRL